MNKKWGPGRLLLPLLLALGVGSAQAQVTNFSNDVNASIDLGLGWLDTVGAFNNPSSAGNAAGLTLLALLEKRASADQDSAAQGYENASAADQARMRRSAAYIINRAFGASFYAYRDGGDAMALSVYLLSGGPDRGEHPDLPGGLPSDLIGTINAIFDRIAANQNQTGGADDGYWCYFNPNCPDSSTTQLVMAGLAAIRSVYSDASYSDAARLAQLNALAGRAEAAYIANAITSSDVCNGIADDDAGHGYNRGNRATHQQTASGTWIQLVGGSNVNSAGVQEYLTWAKNRYRYTNIAGNAFSGQSYYYYLWSSSKAYDFIEGSGIDPNPGNTSVEDIGTLDPAAAPVCNVREVHRDPATVPRVPLFGAGGAGYYNDPNEQPRIYFDYAYSLLGYQAADGQYDANGAPGRWDQYASQAYAILVLSRSTGGGCVDSDGDGICDADDNCPTEPNPDQSDRDQDGVGDVCDNCPDVFNPDQEDSNGNGIGDACEDDMLMCDMDGDEDVDRADLRLIGALRGDSVPPADPAADFDGDGVITVNDARWCAQQCTRKNCAEDEVQQVFQKSGT